MYKLKTFGICVKILWIKEYLNNRRFAVKLNNYISLSLLIINSVRQGPKLGLLLYILYANDIMQNFKFAKVKMYADDLIVYVCSSKIMLTIELNFKMNLIIF